MDLEEEKRNGDFVRKLIQNGHVSACHDISDGGLLTAVAEMAIASASSSQTLGVKLKNPTDIPDHAFFFGEEQSRYILSTNNSEIILREATKYNVKTEILGKTSLDQELTIDKIGNISIFKLFDVNEKWLPQYMQST